MKDFFEAAGVAVAWGGAAGLTLVVGLGGYLTLIDWLFTR